MSKNGEFIGFSEGRLREKPVRLPVLANERDWFAVNKFSGLLPQAHPWYKDQPNVTQLIREQVKAGKLELQRLGISHCYYIGGPECESAGPAIFAKTKQGSDHLKNALGSNQIEFRFRFLTTARHTEAELHCDLPVGPHKSEHRSVITHRYGKKSDTRFRKLAESDRMTSWEAVTFHPRLHQIRLHAAELRIPVFGDPIYGLNEHSETERLKGKGTRNSNLRFSGLALVLVSLNLSRVFGGDLVLEASGPKPFLSLLRKCGLQGAE